MTSRKKGRESSWQDEIESTLQRIQRQSASTSSRRLPDQASAAIGQGLAERLLEGMNQQQQPENIKSVADEIVSCLSQANNTSLAESFFGTLVSHPRDELLQWIPQWILQAEESCITDDSSPCFSCLYCMITAYAACCCKLENASSSVTDTYNRLSLPSSRACMTREFVRLTACSTLLTPLMASCVLNLTSPHAEKMLFLSSLYARGWELITSDTSSGGDIHEFLLWLIESLQLFLHGIPNESRDNRSLSMELAYQWLLKVANMMVECSNRLLQPNDAPHLLSTLFNKLLPHFVVAPGHNAVKPIVDSLCSVVKTVTSQAATPVELDVATWHRLGTLALLTSSTADVSSLLNLLTTLVTSSNNNLVDIVQGILYSVVCIFADNSKYKDVTKDMRQQLDSCSIASESCDSQVELTNIVQLFGHGQGDTNLLPFMTASLERMDPSQVMSALDQSSALLLGCSLLWRRRAAEDTKLMVRAYLKALLQQFPHLGINLLPILFQSIQAACDKKDGTVLLDELQFMCEAVVKDATCAQQVWNFIGGTLIHPDSPTSVRAVAIRMFPLLIANNKKLYRRIVETLGTLVDSKQPEIRLAVAVTIDDLAREDRIRDVSDVIGWIQSNLSDENSSVVHYAVSSLHHLVVAEELDFALVIKVLNKRLCPIGDIDMLLALPGCVLEALVLLLGDGEFDEVDSDDEEVAPTRASQDLIGAPPQVSSAVETLILLANSEALTSDSPLEDAVSRIRTNICKSLTAYSLHSLGLDDEGVQSAIQKSEEGQTITTDSGLRYMDLKRIASTEMQASLDGSDLPGSDPTVALTQKILSLEEDSLGSSIWQKRGKTTGSSKPDRTAAPKAASSALPSVDQIEELAPGPSFSTAVASLLGYSGNDVEDLFNYASEVSEGIHDPISHVFILQGWLRAMSVVWSGILASKDKSKLEAVASVVAEVTSWRDLLENSDISYLALAAFSLYIPDIVSDQDGGSHVDFSTTVDDIRNEVRLAYDSHQFRSREMADLCLGIVGARAVNSRAATFVNESVISLEQSMLEHAGQVSFGASYGLAVILQAAAALMEETDATPSTGKTQQLTWINNIVSLLVDELLSCLTEVPSSFVTLVACLKTGKPASDLVSLISSVTAEIEVSETNEQKAGCLLLSLALCARAVGTVSADLLVCLYRLLNKLPWGIGKGFAAPCYAAQCISCGVLDQNEVDRKIEEYARVSKDLLEGDETRRLTDVLYASIALKTLVPSSGTRTAQLKLIEDLIEEERTSMSDECVSSVLLSATVFVSSFPCLAVGGPMFCSSINLHPTATKDTVAGVVSLLTDVAKRAGNPKSTDRAIESLAVLNSAKSGVSNSGSVSVFETSTSLASTRTKSKVGRASFDSLPIAHADTLLEDVMVRVKPAWELASKDPSKAASSDLSRLLVCLEPLSLPSEFARTLIEPILSTDIEAVKPACVKLLVSQVSGRRRAAFDGRDFLKLVNRISLLPPTPFQEMIGKGPGSSTFIASLYEFLPRLPSDSAEAILLSLWSICDAEIHEDNSSSCAVSYLRSLSRLLETKQQRKGSSQLSPRTRSTIIQVLLTTVLSTLAAVEAESLDVMHPVEESFLDCLSNLDVSVLDDNKFLTIGRDGDESMNLAKAFCAAGLVSRKYFEQEGRSSKQLLKLVAWFASGARNLSDILLRELAFRIAIAAKDESQDSKKEIMSLLFEALHIRGPGPSLTLLGMLASMWSNGVECDPETSSLEPFFDAANQDSILPPETFSNVSDLLVNDMPFNVGVYGRSVKLQGQISNNVMRIVMAWSEQGDTQQDLSPLEGILICCRTLERTREDDLSAIVAAQLSRSIRETKNQATTF